MRRGLNVLFGSSVAAAALLVATQPAGGHSGRSASKPSAGQFHGKTSQRWNLNFRVSADGKWIRPFATSVTLVCRISGTYADTRPFLPRGSARIRTVVS